MLNLGIGSPDLNPPKEVEQALIESLSNPGYHQYQSYKGIPELRKAFSDWYLKYFNVEINPEKELLPLIGSKEGIMHISMALLNERDQVLVPNPGYPSYASATKLAGGDVVNYSLNEGNNYHPDLIKLEEMDLSKVKIMWVNYPHMPTGTDGNQSIFKQLRDFSNKHGIVVINDNPYGFILTKERNSLLKDRLKSDLVLELNSLSKSHNMSGWRVGMVAGNEDLVNLILTFKSNMDSGQFKPIMKAAIAALSITEDWYTTQNEVYLHRRDLVFQVADLLGCSYQKDQVGMFVWAQIPDGFDSGKQYADHLLEKYKIFVPPGEVFGTEGKQYIRFSLCSDVPVWNEVIKRIKEE